MLYELIEKCDGINKGYSDITGLAGVVKVKATKEEPCEVRAVSHKETCLLRVKPREVAFYDHWGEGVIIDCFLAHDGEKRVKLIRDSKDEDYRSKLEQFEDVEMSYKQFKDLMRLTERMFENGRANKPKI